MISALPISLSNTYLRSSKPQSYASRWKLAQTSGDVKGFRRAEEWWRWGVWGGVGLFFAGFPQLCLVFSLGLIPG
jgi:hypothetical protein